MKTSVAVMMCFLLVGYVACEPAAEDPTKDIKPVRGVFEVRDGTHTAQTLAQ